MKIASLACVLVVLPAVLVPARAAEDVGIARMATCQDSWLDWEKSDPGQLKMFGERFRSDFTQSGNGTYLVPKTDISVAGLRVRQAFPNSVGMGVGFSVAVDATFDRTRRTLEKMLGRSLGKCEAGDNMRTCSAEIGPKRTFMLMAEDSAKSTTTLLGCYYYYEK